MVSEIQLSMESASHTRWVNSQCEKTKGVTVKWSLCELSKREGEDVLHIVTILEDKNHEHVATFWVCLLLLAGSFRWRSLRMVYSVNDIRVTINVNMGPVCYLYTRSTFQSWGDAMLSHYLSRAPQSNAESSSCWKCTEFIQISFTSCDCMR